MATSGVTSFSMTVEKIINKAFAKIGVKISEQSLQPEEYQDGLDALNLMIKSWGAQGLHLWTKSEGVLFLDAGKTDYLLGSNSNKSCLLDDFVSTATTTAQSALDKIIPVISSVGMTVSDYIGIELDDNTRHWSTIKSIDSANQVTIVTGIPSVAAIGRSVFTFTTLVDRPNRILSFRRKRYGDDNEIPVITLSRDQYFSQVSKTSQGSVTGCYYSPQLTDGRVYVWQTASSVKDYIRYTYERAIEDAVDDTDDMDFPAEWLEAVIYGLAARLCDDYDVPPTKVQTVTGKSVQFLDDLLGWDEEMTSLNLQPDFS